MHTQTRTRTCSRTHIDIYASTNTHVKVPKCITKNKTTYAYFGFNNIITNTIAKIV